MSVTVRVSTVVHRNGRPCSMVSIRSVAHQGSHPDIPASVKSANEVLVFQRLSCQTPSLKLVTGSVPGLAGLASVYQGETAGMICNFYLSVVACSSSSSSSAFSWVHHFG